MKNDKTIAKKKVCLQLSLKLSISKGHDIWRIPVFSCEENKNWS